VISKEFSKMTIALALGAGLGVAGTSWSDKDSTPHTEKQPVPVQELREFAEVFGRIKQDYVEPVDDKTLLENAIRGMLSGLDPHSSYLGDEEYRELQVGTRGQFGGLGIEVGMEDGFVKVIAPIDDTPAQRAGLQAGDLIIRLDEKPVKGMSLNEAVKMMRGKPGTEITLTVVRKSKEQPFKVKLVRDVVRVASSKGRILEEGYAYLRISHFQSNTTDDMLRLVGKLKKEAGGSLKGLILDLRNNPGGILSAAVSVSDAFLEGGMIVYTKGRTEEAALDYKAAPDDVISGAPMVVLINEGSASASEIVAGALQDHKRAVIMGRPSFGKGSVQTVIPITKKSAVKLTTALYYTPSGRSIQAEGIRPDIVLDELEVTAVEEPDLKAVKEADLARHLRNGHGGGTSSRSNADAASESPLSLTDYQLSQALNLLKGLVILKELSPRQIGS